VDRKNVEGRKWMLNIIVTLVNILGVFQTKVFNNYFFKKIIIDRFIYSKTIEVDSYICNYYRYGGIKIFVWETNM
jgi:hypothetical protein